ncbi:MAG: hypothetical protein ACJAXQ_000204 [Parvibaculaceae bacterium]|jgi:hypothetical protein
MKSNAAIDKAQLKKRKLLKPAEGILTANEC